MKHVIKFTAKDWMKSKLLYTIPFVIICVILASYFLNRSQAGTTVEELRQVTQHQLDYVVLLSTTIEAKEADIGATDEELQSLEPLARQEQYLKEILSDIQKGNLHIAGNQISFYDEYMKFVDLKPIFYLGQGEKFIEKEKAILLKKHNLPYMEEKNPYESALFTKQLIEIFFHPIIALLFLIIFCFRYINDRKNKVFNFFQLQSLSKSSIYLGYFMLLVGSILAYIITVSFLSILPVLLEGNWESFNYPVEILKGTEIVFIPIWKWLLYIPIGWLLFMMFSLVVFFFFVRLNYSLTLYGLTLFGLMSLAYLVYTVFGFQYPNPLHLITAYKPELFLANQYLVYLFGMTVLLILLLVSILILIKSKPFTKLKFPSVSIENQARPLKSKFKLLQFEYRKKKRNHHILIALGIILITFGSVIFISYQQVQELPRISLKQIEEKQQSIRNSITNMEINHENHMVEIEIMKKKDELSGSEPGEYEEDVFLEFIGILNEQYKEYEQLKSLLRDENFPELYNSLQMKYGEASYKDMDSGNWNITLMASEEQRAILEDLKIDPWPLGTFWLSHFNDPSYAEEPETKESYQRLQDQNQKYDKSSLFIFYKYINWNLLAIVFFAYIAFCWTAISEERNRESTLHFLVTKPIRFRSIYFTKWLYNLMIAYVILLLIGAFTFLFAAVLGEIGESRYPIPVYATEKLNDTYLFAFLDQAYFSFKELGSMLLTAFGLIAAQIYFLNGVFSLLGRIMKNHYYTIITTLVIVMIGYWLGIQKAILFNPFIYFDTWKVVDGWKTIETSSIYATPLTGITLLVVVGSILFLAGFFVKRKVNS